MEALEFTAPLERFEKGLYKLHLKVPTELAHEVESYGKDRRAYCILGNRISYHAAIMYEKGIYYIMLNRAKQKSLQLELGDSVMVRLEACKNSYGIDLPEEMMEAMKIDSEAKKLFHELTTGKQRSLFYLIDKIKSPALRAERAWLVLEHLKENKGQLDFKQLQEKFKREGH